MNMRQLPVCGSSLFVRHAKTKKVKLLWKQLCAICSMARGGPSVEDNIILIKHVTARSYFHVRRYTRTLKLIITLFEIFPESDPPGPSVTIKVV